MRTSKFHLHAIIGSALAAMASVGSAVAIGGAPLPRVNTNRAPKRAPASENNRSDGLHRKMRGITYGPESWNGNREVARRQRQIAAGRLSPVYRAGA